MSEQLRVIIPHTFTVRHQEVMTQYLADDRLLRPAEWQLLYQGIDILDAAQFQTNEGSETFRQLYHRYVDAHFATPYLERLLALDNIGTQSPALIAEFASQIAPHLQQANLLIPGASLTRLFYAYCVYWWQNFARGYAFEVRIVRDLRASGVEFYTHDIRDPLERRSMADLILLNLTGDVKISTYFLRLAASRGLPSDFYVTRLWAGGRQRLLVVFQKPAAWKKIDGDTVEGQLSDLLRLLPQPVKLRQNNITLVVIDYVTWKRRVLDIQQQEQDNE